VIRRHGDTKKRRRGDKEWGRQGDTECKVRSAWDNWSLAVGCSMRTEKIAPGAWRGSEIRNLLRPPANTLPRKQALTKLPSRPVSLRRLAGKHRVNTEPGKGCRWKLKKRGHSPARSHRKHFAGQQRRALDPLATSWSSHSTHCVRCVRRVFSPRPSVPDGRQQGESPCRIAQPHQLSHSSRHSRRASAGRRCGRQSADTGSAP